MFYTSQQRQRINRRKKRLVNKIWLYIPILMVCSAVSVFFVPVLIEKYQDGSKKQLADFMQSSPQYYINKTQTFAVVKAVQIQDGHVKEPFKYVQKVNSRKVNDEMEANSTSSEKERSLDFKKSFHKNITTANNEHYVQVGSWRNSKYAEEMLVKVKKYYPEAYIVEDNKFNILRIPGILSKKQGVTMSNDIEKKFNLKPIVVKKK